MAKFTRKHFIELAEIFMLAKYKAESQSVTKQDVVRLVAEEVADFMAKTNPAFDREKFLAACQK